MGFKKKLTRKQLENKTKAVLTKACQKYKIPYFSLPKKLLIDNMMCFQNGKPFLHKDRTKTWAEKKEAPHKLTMRMRKFCLDYATCYKKKPQKKWAKEYDVSVQQLNQWLQWREVRELINVFEMDSNSRAIERISQEKGGMVDEMVKIAKKEPLSDTKRKAVMNMLGMGGIVDQNFSRQNININQETTTVVGVRNIYKMSDEELEQESIDLDIIIKDNE